MSTGDTAGGTALPNASTQPCRCNQDHPIANESSRAALHFAHAAQAAPSPIIVCWWCTQPSHFTTRDEHSIPQMASQQPRLSHTVARTAAWLQRHAASAACVHLTCFLPLPPTATTHWPLDSCLLRRCDRIGALPLRPRCHAHSRSNPLLPGCMSGTAWRSRRPTSRARVQVRSHTPHFCCANGLRQPAPASCCACKRMSTRECKCVQGPGRAVSRRGPPTHRTLLGAKRGAAAWRRAARGTAGAAAGYPDVPRRPGAVCVWGG